MLFLGFSISLIGFGILFFVYVTDVEDIVLLAYLGALMAAIGCYPCVTIIMAWLTDYLGLEKTLLIKQEQKGSNTTTIKNIEMIDDNYNNNNSIDNMDDIKEEDRIKSEQERKAAAKAATGTAMVISVGNSSGFFGPQAFGLCKSQTGEYTYGFLGMTILLFCGIIGCLVLKLLLHLKKKKHSRLLVAREGEKSSLLIFNSSKNESEHNKIGD